MKHNIDVNVVKGKEASGNKARELSHNEIFDEHKTRKERSLKEI